MKRKLLILTQIILIGILGASIGTSVAWFTSNDFLQIDSFDFSIRVNDNLLISTSENGEYKSALTEDDLNIVSTYSPVSSMFSDNWITSKEKNPEFKKGYNMNAVELIDGDTNHPYFLPHEQVADQGYFQQEFYLKSEDDFYATLDLSSGSSFIQSDLSKNMEAAESIYIANSSTGNINDIYNKLNSLEKAMRLSILIDKEDSYKYLIFDPYKSEDTLLGGLIDSDVSGFYDYKKNSLDQKNYEVLYGEVSNRENIVYEYNEFDIRKNKPTTFTSGHAANTNVIDLEESLQNGLLISKEKSISFYESEQIRNNITGFEESYVKDNFALIPLEANKPTRIVVSIYLEGWDTDCVDTTMGASFNCQLSFGLLDRNII